MLGPLSAQRSYAAARSIFAQLAIPRRVAQLDLSLAAVAEMSGKLKIAARRYETLAVDDRLSRRDRARARLWVGTALNKDGNNNYAARVMQAATREFEDLDLQRVIAYPKLGFAIDQDVPEDVHAAYESLLTVGFDSRLLRS